MPHIMSTSEFGVEGTVNIDAGPPRSLGARPGSKGSCAHWEETIRQAVESLPRAIWVQDTDTGETLYVNAAYETLWGRALATLYQDPMSFLDAVHPEDHNTLSLILRGQAGLALSGELRIVRPNGEVVWIECRTSAIEDASGRARRLVLVAEDITERKEAALAAAARLRELEHRNAELDAFAHTAAHNLRSALGLILGNAKLLETLAAPRLEADDLESLQDLVQMARKAVQIVEDLLLLSKVGTEGPQCEPLAMQKIVENALARLAPSIIERGARISLPESWPLALGYAAWVEEVWVNYLDNAVKHGGLRPHIELGAVVLGDGKVRFFVRDHGPGISEPDRTRLFQPFSRLSPPSGEGNGLGLAIVKRIVERLGGEATVESVVEEGSTFSFTLPGV